MQYLNAFLCGGVLCAVGQVLLDRTKLTPARILVSFVVLGVVLGGLGIYQPLLDFAGAGASVPLTGFGALLAKGVREAIADQGAIGILTGGLTAAWRHHHRHCRCPADCPAVPLPGQGIGSSLPGTEILFPVYIPDPAKYFGNFP